MEHGSPYSRAGSSSRGCWYYLRYFFLFVSLIQFLIILGLVLFMVYGNVHETTESNLQASERRAQSLHTQVVELSATRVNLSKELNVTVKSKDSIMQMLLSARRDLDGINASFRQCQTDRAMFSTYLRYIAAIIQSEGQCQEQLKENNKTYNALHITLSQKVSTVEGDLAKEKLVCTKDKEALALGKRVSEEQLAQCVKVQEQLRQERQLAEDRLQKVQTLCLPLDKDKFETEMRNLWRDSIIPRTLDTMGYNMYMPLNPQLSAIQRSCDHLPTLMTSKVDELARSLRAGIERVARENSDLQRQKLDAERSQQICQEASQKVEKETQAREAKLHGECARQTQLALEEKAALRKERDNLAKELEEKRKEIDNLKMQLAVSQSGLDTCIKAKSQQIFMSRPAAPAPNPPPIDPKDLEEFKKKILESQKLPAGNTIALSSG